MRVAASYRRVSNLRDNILNIFGGIDLVFISRSLKFIRRFRSRFEAMSQQLTRSARCLCTMSRMTEGRKVGGPKESGLTGGERASRGVRAARAYRTVPYGTCLGALATVPRMWSRRGVAEIVVP